MGGGAKELANGFTTLKRDRQGVEHVAFYAVLGFFFSEHTITRGSTPQNMSRELKLPLTRASKQTRETIASADAIYLLDFLLARVVDPTKAGVSTVSTTTSPHSVRRVP